MATQKKSGSPGGGPFTFIRSRGSMRKELKRQQRCETSSGEPGALGRWFRDLRPGAREVAPLERSNPVYHSEGKGLRRRKDRDRRRHSFNEQQPEGSNNSAPDGKDAATAARMARDVMMSNLQQQQHASIYSYLHTQSGLNFAPVVPHRQEDSPPPTPPVRDASSLKGVKYGPGHEKFPSWPVSAAADTPAAARPAPGGGSHRSKSWTDHTNYPKEKGLTYTRPYMKRTNPAFTQQLKTVMERCEKISPETFEPRPDVLEDTQGRLYLPHLDREGNALGDMDYLAPSPPERDIEEYKTTSSPLTQADLEEYARAYQPQQQPSYAQSEGYHSYVSSSDSTTTTPFLDRLRRDSEMTGRPVPGPQTPAWDDGLERDGRPGRDSVVTTSSGSASSSETLKWRGSLSDVSVASSSCTQQGGSSSSSSSRQLIAHSSRVQTPQRHHSESVLYLGSEARVQRNNHHNKLRLFPVNTYTVQPQEQPGLRTQQPLSPSSQPALSVAERISELERQQMLQTRYTYLDPDKRHRVSDPTLKAIQKKALLSFYERHHHANGQARGHQAWRSEPQLAQPVPRPQSPPPPQPPPRPRANQSPRRASSASDYAGGAWREMAANREAGASSDSGTSNMRENSRHQHSSSCGSLSSDLLGPLIVGPSISVDDWVPERPPKKPHLRAAFAPPVPDRLPSPDLPPPSPPPMLEDEVFATDEPLPPPPPELHSSDWSVALEKTSNLESNCERYLDRLAEYTNLPSRSSEAPMSPPRHSESNPSSSQKLSLLRSQEPTSSLVAPLSPTRTSSSSSQPDVIPSVHRHSEYDSFNSSSIHIALQKHEAGTNLPEICSVEQKSVESALQKHPENRNAESSSSQRYSQYTEQTRHTETGFTVQRYIENGATTGHQRLLESGHAVHRHLETSVQQKQQENPNAVHRHLETSVQQKQQENPHTVHRHVETSVQQKQQENPHAVHRHLETSVQQKQQENPHAVHRHLETSVQQKQQENPHTVHRHLETSTPQKQQENPHTIHRHLETSVQQKQQENPHTVHRHLETSVQQKQQENPHTVHRHLETSVQQKQQENPHTVYRHLETLVQQKQQENPHAVTQNLETLVQQKQQENPHAVHRNLETPVQQKQQENHLALLRHATSETNHLPQKYMESCSWPTVQTLHENEMVPSHLTYLQQAETNSSCRRLSQVHKREDSESNLQSTDSSSARHSEKDCSSRSRGLESSSAEPRSSPQQNGTENISENGIVTSRHVDALHQRYLEGGTLSRRHLESNRSLDGSTSLYRYQDNIQSQKHYNPLSTSGYRNTGSMFSRPSGMRSTENLHQKTDGSRAGDHWSNLKYSTQKLVVNGKLAAPLSERTVQNGGFTESVRMSDLNRLSKREFSSMPARARLQRLPLAVPNGDTISHVQVSPSPAGSPGHAPTTSPARSPGHAPPMSPSDSSSSPSSTVNDAAGSPAGSPTHSQQTTSKASYLASYRRDRDRGVPNFEGSYKRIMSPSGHETSLENSSTPVPECDRLSIPGEAEEVNHTAASHPEEASDSRTKDEEVVVDRLTDSDAKDTDSGVVSCGVVETEIQCDLITETELPPPSPPPPPSPSPSPKVTESLQLVQRSEVVLRVNAATSDASSQTEAEGEKEVVDEAPVTVPTTMLVRPKTQEEIECERLSLDVASHLSPSDKLQTLLVPDPEHKKPTDYVSGLFRLDVALRPRPTVFRTQTLTNGNSSSSAAPSDQTPSEDAAKDNNTSPLPANSKYFQISEPKAKFLNRYVQDMGQLNGLHDNKDLHRKKEELMTRLARKLEVLRGEQLVVMEEATVNDQLGESVAAQVSRVARPHELGKYRLHVEEVGKITSLLLGLSGRLARAENALMGLPLHHSERKILESKRDKLREQLEEAKKLKENIDRRSVNVSNILYKYFNSEEYADYDHFINMKAKLIMDSREIADKIKLGEEQLAALKETLCCNMSD
ncbi:protein Shroom isoform X2 [Anabrus simplex]|uniref:protein Shroom isoform X2 n=1 Tax=Anabrus simplex TaxID=316456 RepID=UPI0035A2D383